jgi:hypothetical protein
MDAEGRLRLMMEIAILETDGGDRGEVITEFIRMVNEGEKDDTQELRDALGPTGAERYERACDLFREVVQSGARPKRGA